MTLRETLKLLQCNKTELARMLGISKGAISHWDMDKPIPERHQLRLRYELKPKLFKKSTKTK